MSKHSVLIYNIPILFDIFNEIKENFDFEIHNLKNLENINKDKFYKKYSSSKTNKGRAFLIQLIFENIPYFALQYMINSGEEDPKKNYFAWHGF